MGPHGIIDARVLFYIENQNLSEGGKLELAVRRCNWALGRHACEFKVGIARELGVRFQMYRNSPDRWQPTHLFILLEVVGRTAAGYAEAALIRTLWDRDLHDDNVEALAAPQGNATPASQ